MTQKASFNQHKVTFKGKAITFKVSGNAFPKFIPAPKPKDHVKRALQKAASIVLRAAKVNAKNTLNTTGGATGTLVRSIKLWWKSWYTVHVGTEVIYGRIHEFGGTIKPVKAKYLTIPIGSRHGNASEHSDLHFVKIADGRMFLVDEGGAFQYVLKDQVEMPARPYLRPAVEDNHAKVEAFFTQELSDMLVQ